MRALAYRRTLRGYMRMLAQHASWNMAPHCGRDTPTADDLLGRRSVSALGFDSIGALKRHVEANPSRFMPIEDED